MNSGTDQQQKPTLKQLEELLRFTQGQTAAVVTRYFATATFGEIQSVLQNQKNVGRTFERLLAPLLASTDAHSSLRAYWERIYRDHYGLEDRKSTRLNSSHSSIPDAAFCFKETDLITTCPKQAARFGAQSLNSQPDRYL